MTITQTAFDVHGLPVPQGSKRLGKHGSRFVVLDDNDRQLAPWRNKITAAAATAHRRPPFDTPLTVKLVFALPAPLRLPPGRVLPSVRPDADKLARAALDAMTGIVYTDDSRVCHLDVWKVYAAPGRPAGVAVTVTVIDGAQAAQDVA